MNSLYYIKIINIQVIDELLITSIYVYRHEVNVFST